MWEGAEVAPPRRPDPPPPPSSPPHTPFALGAPNTPPPSLCLPKPALAFPHPWGIGSPVPPGCNCPGRRRAARASNGDSIAAAMATRRAAAGAATSTVGTSYLRDCRMSREPTSNGTPNDPPNDPLNETSETNKPSGRRWKEKQGVGIGAGLSQEARPRQTTAQV